MKQGLHDLTRHNSWATAQLITYCQGLDESTLVATVPGTYGSIIETMRHLVESEASYLSRVATGEPMEPWEDIDTAGLAILAERATAIAADWESYLADGADLDRLAEAHGDDGTIFLVPAEIRIAQAIHHGTEHRAHICSILGSLGFEPPILDLWEYAIVTGRSSVKSTPES